MRVHFVPTYRCTMNCSYCYAAGLRERFRADLSMQQYRLLLDYLLAHGLQGISFLGGEPTLWAPLADAVELARQVGLECAVFSNGAHVGAVPHLVVLNLTRCLQGGISTAEAETIDWYRRQQVQISFRLNLAAADSTRYRTEIADLAGSLNADIQLGALNGTPHATDYGRKFFDWCRFLVDHSLPVRITRPLARCLFTEEQHRYLTSHVETMACCDFTSSIPVINPDGKTVFPCNSLPVPLPLTYLHAKRSDFEELHPLYPCRPEFMPRECRGCPSYLQGECHAGCIGTRTEPAALPTPRHAILPLEQITRRQPYRPRLHCDWGTTARIVAKTGSDLANLASGYLKLGYACNNQCRFCTVEWQKTQGNRDTGTVFAEMERLLTEHSISTLHYSGGEPTLRDDLPRLLLHARRLGVQQQIIQTNGRRLQQMDYLQALLAAGATSFFVSLHSPDQEVHDELVRAPGAFQQTCAGLANLHRLGCCFSLNTVVCRQNYLSLARIVRLALQHSPSLRKAKLSYPNLQGGAADHLDSVVAPLWEVMPYVLHAIATANDMGLFVDTEAIPICLLGPYCDRASELLANPYHVSDLGFQMDNWTVRERAHQSVFYPVCRKCDLRDYCCGIHPLHHASFGEDLCFTPISFDALLVNA